VPDIIAGSPEFLIAVGLGAGLTVFLATVSGFPISTTHGLTGALAGAGVMAVGTQVNFAVLGTNFFLPLLISPVIALSLSMFFYGISRRVRIRLGIEKEMCICIGETECVVPVPAEAGYSWVLNAQVAATLPEIAIDSAENCFERYKGSYFGIRIQTIVDHAHFLSSGIVSFARGLNDTPKIVAILAVSSGFGIQYGMIAVAAGMTAGGLLNAAKVADTMSHKISPMTHSQGFAANIVTGLLVVAASRYGMPVSTTHVAVGSIFGIGLLSNQANKRVIGKIALSWVLTLPIAALLGAFTYWLVSVFS
jgi:PiT family inorganic phosphate transporter